MTRHCPPLAALRFVFIDSFPRDWNLERTRGRLYTTTLSILTLEVYYRYLPMYHEAFIDEAP